MDLFIRPAGPADAEEIADVQRVSWQATYGGLLRPESLERVERVWNAAHWRHSLERVDDRVVTLVLDGPQHGVVGFGVAGPSRNHDKLLGAYAGEVYLLYLIPAVQNRGHGVRMMAAMARVLRARGIDTALVWALASNRAAVGFYQHLGGRIVMQCRKSFFGESVNEIALGWNGLDPLTNASRNLRQ